MLFILTARRKTVLFSSKINSKRNQGQIFIFKRHILPNNVSTTMRKMETFNQFVMFLVLNSFQNSFTNQFLNFPTEHLVLFKNNFPNNQTLIVLWETNHRSKSQQFCHSHLQMHQVGAIWGMGILPALNFIRWNFKSKLVKLIKEKCTENTAHEDPILKWKKNPNKFVILEVFGWKGSQETMLSILSRYSKMRDYINIDITLFAPFTIIENLMATGAKATLLASTDVARDKNISEDDHPHLLSNVNSLQLFSEYPSLLLLYRQFRFHPKGRLYFSHYPEPDFNFVYCEATRWVQVKAWDVSIIGHGIDKYVWLAFVTNLIFLVIILRYRSVENCSSLRILISVISAFIAPSQPACREIKRSLLFTFWIFCCLILSTYYTGEYTGFMIIPPEKDIMTELSHLLARKYSLLFYSPWALNTLRAAINATNAQRQRNNDHEQEIRMIIKSLLPTGTVMSNRTQFLEELALAKSRKAFFHRFPYAIEVYNEATRLIKQRGFGNSRTCYLGKNLVPDVVDRFFTFTPPGAKELYKSAQKLKESGIFAFWHMEYWKRCFAGRVQDRVKVVSPTFVKENVGQAVQPLHIHGKVLPIFFIWGICLIISLVCFIFEGRYTLINFRGLTDALPFHFTGWKVMILLLPDHSITWFSTFKTTNVRKVPRGISL